MRFNNVRLVRAALLAALIAGPLKATPAQAQTDTDPGSRASAPAPAAAGAQRPTTTSGAPAAAAATAATATIRGSVFYNDRRTDGLFAARRDKNGNPGQRCGAWGTRDGSSTPCSLNWLAGKYMVVDVIEHDLSIPPRDAGPGCVTQQKVGSAAVAYDGSFVVTIGANDGCTTDQRPNLAIELRVRLRFCNESSYCFSVNRSVGNPYTISHPGANGTNPLTVRAGADVTVAAMNFNTAADASTPNNDSIAANYYASLVDTVLALHKDQPIPFFYAPFGEVEYIFPSTESSTATTKSASKVVFSTFQSQPDDQDGAFAWVDGKTPAHEYGHVLMLRAWDGVYGFDGIGISAGSDEIAPSQQIAFKEGWAEFIPRVVFTATRGCQRSSYDDNGEKDCSAISRAITTLEQQRKEQIDLISKLPNNAGRQAAEEQLTRIEADLAKQRALLVTCQNSKTTTDLPGDLGEGAMWRDNITKALCDWYDDRDDNDTRLAGSGDHFAAEDIHSMWDNLRRMRLDAANYGGRITNPGLWFCDYVNYYLKVRKSAAEVGAASHASYEASIRDLIYNNNIACSMAPPN